jgi:hypothetical protein
MPKFYILEVPTQKEHPQSMKLWQCIGHSDILNRLIDSRGLAVLPVTIEDSILEAVHVLKQDFRETKANKLKQLRQEREAKNASEESQ